MGVEAETISRWSRNAIFRNELARRRAEVLESIRSELASTVRAALTAVREGLSDAEISSAVRLQSATSFLGKLMPGLLRIEPEEPDIGEVLKAEADRRRERFTDSVLDGTSEIEEEARSELERDA